MKIVTLEEFKEMKEVLGGDLWNQHKLCRIAFKKYPQAVEIEYSIGTGLWVDIRYKTADGEQKLGTVYDGDDHRSF